MKNKIKLAMTTAYLSHWQLPRQLRGNRHCLLFIAMSSCHDNQPPHLSLADWKHPALLWFLSFASNNSPSLFFYHHPQLSLIPFFFNWICDPLNGLAVTSVSLGSGLGRDIARNDRSGMSTVSATYWDWVGKQTLFSHVSPSLFLFAKLGWYPTLINA